jgi:F-box and leucine-rich repeat protein GRR1
MFDALDVSAFLKGVTDGGLQVIAQKCSNLKCFNLNGCLNISDRGIHHVARHCRELQRLHLKGCFRVTDHSIVALAHHCPTLLELDLRGCFLTQEAVRALITACSSMEKFDMSCIEVGSTHNFSLLCSHSHH